MRSKGAEAVSTLEGDPPEDGGVSNSVPSGGISQWVSSTSASHTSSDMLYVNLEETFPPSPPFLERDPNMSSTARYSPLHGAPATLPSLPPIQHTSLLPTYQHETIQIKSINTNVYGEDNRNIISVESYSLSPSINANVSQIDDLHHSVISQYMNSYSDHVVNNNSLQSERLAPLLNAIDEVSCGDDIQHDGNGGFYSQQMFVTRENFGITNNENVYLPSTGMSSECASPTNQRLTTSADIELVYSPNGEYNIIEKNSMKTQNVELLINGGQSNIPYSLPKENGFIMACSVDNSCDIVKNSGDLIASIEDTMQYNSNQSIEMSEESDDLNLNIGNPGAEVKQKIRLLIASIQNESLKSKAHSEFELDFRHFEKDTTSMHIKENINIVNADMKAFKDEDQKTCNNRRGRKQLTDIDISITCIPDKSVPCRAKASLPASHLSLCNTKNKDSTVFGVFARRRIPIRARFGPLEGVRKPLTQDVMQNFTESPVFFVRAKDSDFMIDVSDENMSNWMRYVRFSPGPYQNVCLQQLDDNLYFTSSKPIPPNAELLLGYGATYARQWNLPTIVQTHEPTIDWPCFECSMQFMSSAELQDHLNIHDEMNDSSVNKIKKKTTKEVIGNNHCVICTKTFPRSYSLKRHMRTHEIDAGIDTRIDQAFEQSEDNVKMEKEVIKPVSIEDAQISFNNQNNFNMILTEHSLDTIDGKMMDIDDIKLEENNSMDSISMISKDLNLENALQMYDEENQTVDNAKKDANFENNMEVEEESVDKLSFCCLLCGKTFYSSSLLSNHARNEHRQSDGSYSCKLCPKRFPDYVAIRKHIRRNHSDQIKSVQNDDCTTKSDKLNTSFSCPHCHKQFKRKDKVKEHIKKQQRVINNNKEVIFLCAERAHSMLSDNQTDSSAYLHFTYKCHPCRLGFKRRGMLVNHLARRHPEVSRATVPELQLPIMRAARDYFCQHCDKVYKSSSKRKAHILKNHPGESLPPSSRDLNSSESKELEALGYSTCVGAIKSAPHHCPYTPCHKQYASKAKLSQHIRHKHMSADSMESTRDDKSSQNDNSDKDENKGENQFCEEAEVLQMNEDLMDDENIFIPSPEDDTLMSKIVRSASSQRMDKSMSSFEIINEGSVMLDNSSERSDNFMDKDLSEDNYLNDFSNSLMSDKDKSSKTHDDFDKTVLNEYVYSNQKNFPLMLLFSGVKMTDKSDTGYTLNDTSKVHISGHIVSMETNKPPPLKSRFAENSYSSQYTDR